MNEVIVLGQGYVGLPVAMQVAKAGFKVFGFDIDPDKITKLNNGVTVGVSVGKYWSPLNSSFDKYWNGMVRLNYSFKRKGCKFTGTPSF